jgi:hypothetical protein
MASLQVVRILDTAALMPSREPKITSFTLRRPRRGLAQ